MSPMGDQGEAKRTVLSPTTMLLGHESPANTTPEPKSKSAEGEGLSPFELPPFAVCSSSKGTGNHFSQPASQNQTQQPPLHFA